MFGVAGLDQRDVVDVLRQVRQFLANPGATLAVLSEAKRRFHQRTGIAEVSVNWRGRPLAIVPRELGFRIEEVKAARPAFHH
jgi:hypothetical protein